MQTNAACSPVNGKSCNYSAGHLNSDQDGAIIFQSDGQGVQVKAAKEQHGLLAESLDQLF